MTGDFCIETFSTLEANCEFKKNKFHNTRFATEKFVYHTQDPGSHFKAYSTFSVTQFHALTLHKCGMNQSVWFIYIYKYICIFIEKTNLI